MREMLRRFLDEHGYHNWLVTNLGTLECPCGHVIEQDGKCPDGCTSPMVKEGII